MDSLRLVGEKEEEEEDLELESGEALDLLGVDIVSMEGLMIGR